MLTFPIHGDILNFVAAAERCQRQQFTAVLIQRLNDEAAKDFEKSRKRC